jgi:TPP-dependent indolepyruvate ferredoxin oxidoreductase alpha subunit
MLHNLHSLHKRILITKELEPLTEKTVKTIVEQYKLSAESFYKIGVRKNWTTIDIAYVSTALAKAKLDPTEENIMKIAQMLGR